VKPSARGRGLLLAAAFVVAACNRGPKGDASLPSGAVRVPGEAVAPAPSVPARTAPPALVAGGAPLSLAPIVKAANASVVTITTAVASTGGGMFFGRQSRQSKGLGTGFIVEGDGLIVTNNHVIEGADAVDVQLADEQVFPAKVVGADPVTDLALVRIEGKGLPALPLGDSAGVEVGDWVVAIGNPFGLSHTVSVGIVSAKGRTRDEVPIDQGGYYDFLQTDASINPGNSGGPLLDLSGRVVGVNTAIRGDAQGIGFAIPIDMVKQLLPLLKRDGRVKRSALGVSVRDLREVPPADRAVLKLPESVARGVVVWEAVPGGPAAAAGLASGDVIVAFEGQPVTRATELQWLASTAGIGKAVTLRVIRAGEAFDLKVTLGALAAPGPWRR
jgi:serine protease Do